MVLEYNDCAKSIRDFDENTQIDELFTFDGICYWWFIDRWIYDEHGVFSKKRLKTYKLLYCFKKYLKYCDLFTSKILQTFVIKNKKTPKKQPEIPRISFPAILQQWRSIDNINCKCYSNPYYHDILNILYNENDCSQLILEVFDIISYIGNHSKLKIVSKSISSKSTIHPLLIDWSPNVWTYECSARRYFESVWKKIKASPSWCSKLSDYTGSEHEILLSSLRYYLIYLFPRMAATIKTLDNYHTHVQPNIDVITHEQTFIGRCVLTSAKRNRISTIGIQHGLLPTFHSGYFYHNQDDMPKETDKDLLSYPIPDLTLVWGELDYNRFLQYGYYPKQSIRVTGCQRYDSIISKKGHLSKYEFCKKYSISINTTIVLWATQSHAWDMNENYSYFEEVFSTFSVLPQCTLVIKQHPNESSIFDSLIIEYCKKYPNVNCISLPRNSVITDAISISDILIVKTSTSGQEAILFEKPLIILDFTETPDFGKYVSEGVAIGAYSPGSLYFVLTSPWSLHLSMHEARKKYIRNYLYSIDGMATKRCIDAIVSIITK